MRLTSKRIPGGAALLVSALILGACRGSGRHAPRIELAEEVGDSSAASEVDHDASGRGQAPKVAAGVLEDGASPRFGKPTRRAHLRNGVFQLV